MVVIKCVLAGIILIINIVALLYELKQLEKNRNLNKESVAKLYMKDEEFSKAKNRGDDPCKIEIPFELPDFSQDCDYLVLK